MAVKCMRCSTCERMSRPRGHKPSRIPMDGERSNERLCVDMCDVLDVRGNGHWWLVAVGQHTSYFVVAPCLSHESQAVATKTFKHGIRWAGPPDVLVCDGERGSGASEFFTEKLSVSGTQVQTTAAHSPWQKGRVEQRIATIKEVAGKTSHVSCQQRGCPRAEPKSREVEHPPRDTSFWPANEMEHGESFSIRRWWTKDSQTFHHSGVSARGLGRTCCFGSDQKSSWHTFPANEDTRAWYPLFLLQTPPRQTSGNGNARTILGPAALIGPHSRSCWWVRCGGRACLRGVTLDEADCLGLDERRQLDELLRAAREVPENYEDLTSQPGPPPPVEVSTEAPREPEEPSRDGLDIGMDAVEQMTLLEGAGDTVSSTEIPVGETGGSPQFRRARLEETLDDEQEKTGEDEKELIGPEDILMTKSQGEPNSSTASSILDKRQYDRETSFHELPKRDDPLYQEAERVQWDEWVTHGSAKIYSSVEAPKIRQQVSGLRERHVCTQDLQKRWSVGSRRESPARESKSAISHSGSALPGQCSRLGENRRSDSAPVSGERIPSNCVMNGMVSESQGCGRVGKPREIETPLFF